MSLKKAMIGLLLFGIVAEGILANELKTKVWNFEDIKTGSLPSSWQVSATNPKEPLTKWEVTESNSAPSGNKVLTLSKINNIYGGTFNLCYTNSVGFKDGEISVKFKAGSGHIDQGGGIMWRVQDSGNYYVARFNPLEDNFRFYIVENGLRKELASADVHLAKGWQEMRIVQKGEVFAGYLDGKKLLEYKDSRLNKSGGAGLWTKADAATSFDDFSVTLEK